MAKPVKKPAKKAAKKTAKSSPKKVAKKAAKKITKKASKKNAPKPGKKPGKKFLIIYHAPFEAIAQTMNVTPEQQAEGMALWMAWAKRAGQNITDLGAPLINGKRINAKGESSPSTKEVSGYSLMEAEDWEELLDLLEGHPHISGWHPEATIEIHETMLLPGM
ncbi:MAG: hypothetical protein JST87_19610 [Bacteroidetes bacterium]|nr:hypothetical protein [Bacteroidota bacterium]